MILFPNAKINLGLNIIAKRKDGYHELQTCMYPIGWRDVLEMVGGKRKTSLSTTGLEIPGAEKDNLVLRAYELLRKDYDLPPLEVQLHKIIPSGAGLGGGSADAAFMLKAVNEMFQLFLDDSILEDYAARLGSDCPFFIQNKPMLATGRGEVLESLQLNLEGYQLLVIKPPLHISTAEAYAGVQPKQPAHALRHILETKTVAEWRGLLHNDFEDSLFPRYPQLENLKEQLYQAGALYASMSGSGSAMFGIFKERLPELSLPGDYVQWRGSL